MEAISKRQGPAPGANGAARPTKKRVQSSTGRRKGNPGLRNGSKTTPGKASEENGLPK